MRVYLSCLLLTAGLMLGASAPAEENLGRRVLWHDKNHEQSLFIPQEVLEHAELKDLPLSFPQRDVLRQVIAKFRDPRWGVRCNSSQRGPVQGSSEETYTFEEYLEGQEVVTIGTIIRVVPGWDAWHNRVARVAYIEVEEVWVGQDLDGGPSKGSIVGLLFDGGETVVAGTSICEDSIPGLYSPVLGDRLLMAGRAWPADPLFLDAAIRFPVVAGDVLAQPYTSLRGDQVSRPLGALVRELIQDPERKRIH